MWFEGIAWAQSGAGQAGSGNQLIWTTIVPLGLLFAIFYFLLIRPQTKRASEHAQMLKALKRNDEVVTNGGLIGRIAELGDKVVTLEIASSVRVRVDRAQIASLSPYGKGSAKRGKES